MIYVVVFILSIFLSVPAFSQTSFYDRDDILCSPRTHKCVDIDGNEIKQDEEKPKKQGRSLVSILKNLIQI